jgi:serine/threonine protein kinase
MTKVTTNKLLDLVRRSGLVDEARVKAFLDKTAAAHGEAVLDDKNRLADLMVEAGLLTRWQADKLLAGKHKGFRLGKYRLLGQIGKGGMSSVYLAEHELMKRRVAVKVLPQNRVGDASYLERFRLEARAVAKLDDPNIVRAYDIDNEGNIHYIVMEYVDGQDLHQIVSQQGPLDYDVAADYIAQVASALQHAHQMGLVHRDIKPANCLVDRHETVKLLDLGLAKLTEDDQSSLTMANEENVLGTADYLAPEQALNSHGADCRSDIYSLGCTLYFLLTGRPPFPEGSISERLLKHQTTTPESIFKARPDAPPSLVDICERMMAKKPDDRFQSAADLSECLTEWLAARGRTLGGGRIAKKEDPGVGSGIFSRFALGVPTPTPGVGASGSSNTVSVSDRDTHKIDGGGSSATMEEDIGLAPLDEEDVLGDSHARLRKDRERERDKDKDKKKSGSDARVVEPQVPPKLAKPASSGSNRSLIEEELHDPEMEAIKRRVALRAQFNPLQPPGYVPPGQQSHMGVAWLLVGGFVLVVAAVIFALLLALPG